MFLVRIDGVGRMLSEQEYLSRHDFYLIVWDFLLIGSSFLLGEIFQLFFNSSILFSFFFSLLFPFICTALFILNVKIKIWYYLKFEDIGMHVYMCYTCHVQIFFVFFLFKRYVDIYLFLFFLQEFLFLFFPLLWI